MTPRNQVIHGDAVTVLPTLANSSVDCVVTSPPYFNARDYGGGARELGREAVIEGWVAHLREVAAEIARVLTPTGSFWLNVADMYATTPGEGAPRKSLLLGPERLANALLEDGWIVRNRIAWVKPNPMPSSAADRLTQSWEVIYLLVRSARPFFDLDAIREPWPTSVHRPPRPARARRVCHGQRDHGHSGLTALARSGLRGHPLGKNPGDAWRITGARVRGHGASFPPELVRRPILATCPEHVCTACGQPWQRDNRLVRWQDGQPQPRPPIPCGCGAPSRPGLVLDPFMGSGTVALVARQHHRDWLGIELNPSFVQLTHDRLARQP